MKCQKCGTKVRLDEGEYHTYNYDSVKWDCPLCGEVKSEISEPITVLSVLERLCNFLDDAERWVRYHAVGLLCGLPIAFMLILMLFLVNSCGDMVDAQNEAPYRFYAYSYEDERQITYYSQIEPTVDDKGVIWYVDVNGDEQILSGYELVAVIEQGENEDGTD